MSRPDQPGDLRSSGDDVGVSNHRQFIVRRDPKQRLDKYLRQRLKHISRNQIQKLIDSGGVTINAAVAKASATVRRHDVLDVILPPAPLKTIAPESIPLDVLYEDEHFIVVNKQANLVVHPARSHLSGTLLNALAHHFTHGSTQREVEGLKSQVANQKSHASSPKTQTSSFPSSSIGEDECRPGVVHRLDKNTTGVIVVAKSDTAHWQIARQFENRTPLKAYLAVVHGEIGPPGGVIDAPIGKHPTIREAYAVRHDRVGRPSVTLYRVRERYRGFTLVELELKTGRTHQIRVHLSYMGYPVVGDIIYGGDPVGQADLDHPSIPVGARRMTPFARTREQGLKIESQSEQRSDLIMDSPALHATLLAFIHPALQQVMTFTAPIHEPMVTLVRCLRERATPGPVAEQGYSVDMNQVLPDEG